jgi:hypothetical protein
MSKEASPWDPNMLVGKLGYYHYTMLASALILVALLSAQQP